MEDVKHLYTVLAIAAFLALPVLMHGGAESFAADITQVGSPDVSVRPDDVRQTPPLPLSAVPDVAAAPPSVTTHDDLRGAPVNALFKQRWIDDPSKTSCHASGSSQVALAQSANTPHGHCLII